MTDPTITLMAVAHVVAATVRRALPASGGRDQGAVSIEQVLWYAAAAISVAVVAAIIWSQIRSTASTPVNQPSAP